MKKLHDLSVYLMLHYLVTSIEHYRSLAGHALCELALKMQDWYRFNELSNVCNKQEVSRNK